MFVKIGLGMVGRTLGLSVTVFGEFLQTNFCHPLFFCSLRAAFQPYRKKRVRHAMAHSACFRQRELILQDLKMTDQKRSKAGKKICKMTDPIAGQENGKPRRLKTKNVFSVASFGGLD